MSGEDLSYQEELEQETFGIDKDPADITPVDIRSLPPVPNLRPLPGREWPQRLTPEETAARAIRSEQFLKMPIVHFPAEEANDKHLLSERANPDLPVAEIPEQSTDS